MSTPLPNDRRRATEYFGQGQSGYTAGRVEGDHALPLQLEPRNVGYADRRDEHPLQLDTDERFTGTGGLPWGPEEPAPDDEQQGG